MEPPVKLSDYLNSLGTTSEEVAQSLRRAGIKGVRVSTCACPILKAIYDALPDYWPGLKIYGKPPSYHASLGDSQICDPALPAAVIAFISDFDLGKYPDLELSRSHDSRVRMTPSQPTDEP